MAMPLGVPPPPKSTAATTHLTTDPRQILLADALDRIRKTQPALFSQLLVTFHGMLDPEARHVVRAPPPMLPTAQGRAQVAEDVLAVLDNCAAIVAQSQQRTNTVPPRGNP